MPWVPFEKAAQASPGVKMRRLDRMVRKGRPKELRVASRGYDRNYGNVICFDNGTLIKISDAKGAYEIKISSDT